MGRETRQEFNESLGMEKADKETLGSSILFTSRDYGKPIPYKAPKWARKVTKEQLRFRPTKTWEYGYWWIEGRPARHDSRQRAYPLRTAGDRHRRLGLH